MCNFHVAMGSPGRPGISYNSIWQFPGGKYSAVKYNGVGVVYSTAIPQLLRSYSASSPQQGGTRPQTSCSSVLENTLVAAMRIFKPRDPSTDESAISPASGLSTHASGKPLAAQIALASLDGPRCLNF